MTVFWPQSDEDKQRYIDYFNLPAVEQLQSARDLITLIKEQIQIDLDHFKDLKKPRCSEPPCKPPMTTAGDCITYCYACYNIRPDYYEWFHARKMLCARWGNVPFDRDKAKEYFKLVEDMQVD